MANRCPAWVTDIPVAHRGLHDLGAAAPENSLAAFDAAAIAGYPIECDVRVLGDGTTVVFHDSDLRRACGVDGALRDYGWEELAPYRLFGTNEPIPRLADVLALVDNRVPLMVELKKDDADDPVAPAAWAELRRYSGRYVVQSFRASAMRWFREHAPDVVRGQLGGPLRVDSVPWAKRMSSRLLLGAIMSRPDFLNFDLRALPDAWVEAMGRRLGVPLLCWTVKNARDQRKAERLRLNYVFDRVRPEVRTSPQNASSASTRA